MCPTPLQSCTIENDAITLVSPSDLFPIVCAPKMKQRYLTHAVILRLVSAVPWPHCAFVLSSRRVIFKVNSTDNHHQDRVTWRRDALSKGIIVLGPLHPRDVSSKGGIVAEQMFGDTSVGDGLRLHQSNHVNSSFRVLLLCHIRLSFSM